MATLANLRTALEYRLGTNASQRFKDAVKTEALNWARREIINKHDLEEFIVESSVSFTAGVGTLPSNYLRTLNYPQRTLYNSSDVDYMRVTLDYFDENIGYTFTIKNDSGTLKLYIYEADTTTLTFRYVKKPTDLSADADDSEMPPLLDDAHVLLACYQLLFSDRQYGQAEEFRRYAEKIIQGAIGRTKHSYGMQAGDSFSRAKISDEIIL